MYAYDFRYVNYYVEAVTGRQDGSMMCVCEEVRYGGGGSNEDAAAYKKHAFVLAQICCTISYRFCRHSAFTTD